MKKPRFAFGGLICECPVCDKTFFVSDPDVWVYKREANITKYRTTILYFDRYSCKRKYEKRYEQDVKIRRIEAAKLRHRGKLKSDAEENDYIDGKICGTCFYCCQGHYGFYDCLVKGWAVNQIKTACSAWKPKEETNGFDRSG